MSAPEPPQSPRARREAPAAAAILDATEALLARRRFSELSVRDIIATAGVSRTSFYAHFASRGAVLAACLRRAAAQIGTAVDPSGSEAPDDPAPAIRAGLRRWVEIAVQHGPLLRTVSEQWPRDPELRQLWLELMAGFSSGLAQWIERARTAGAAPPGADARALATVTMWGCERVLHVALVGGAVGLEDPATIVEPLAQMIISGAFLQPPDRARS